MSGLMELPKVAVPGLNVLLGLPRRQATEAPMEGVEELCARISRGRPGPFRVHVAADGAVTVCAAHRAVP
jgi:hypothetical protein